MTHIVQINNTSYTRDDQFLVEINNKVTELLTKVAKEDSNLNIIYMGTKFSNVYLTDANLSGYLNFADTAVLNIHEISGNNTELIVNCILSKDTSNIYVKYNIFKIILHIYKEICSVGKSRYDGELIDRLLVHVLVNKYDVCGVCIGCVQCEKCIASYNDHAIIAILDKIYNYLPHMYKKDLSYAMRRYNIFNTPYTQNNFIYLYCNTVNNTTYLTKYLHYVCCVEINKRLTGQTPWG